jgi:hypothetical protein
LVIIDSCHAEGMATAKGKPAEIKLPANFAPTAPPKSLIDNLKRGEGRAVFTSSRGQQSSWIRNDGTMSIYTCHLIEALQGAGSQLGETVVRLSHLMNHISQAVPQSAGNLCQAEQTPFFDLAAEDFAVALLSGGKGLPPGGWEERNNQIVQRVLAEGKSSISDAEQFATGEGDTQQEMVARDESKIEGVKQRKQ